jgi:hypothetical protein
MDADENTDVALFGERAFQIGNGADELSENYYRRQLRSLSVGDPVRIGLVWLSCERVGWRTITDHAPNDITDIHEGEHGTQPWVPWSSRDE